MPELEVVTKNIRLENIIERVPKIITMDSLAQEEIPKLADVRTKQWADVLLSEHGSHKAAYKSSFSVLRSRKRIAGELQLILYDGEPRGAIHPLRRNSFKRDFTDDIFVNWHVLTGNGDYKTHEENGNTVVCPEVYSSIPGGGRALIFCAINLAKKLKSVEHIIVYTRPFISAFLGKNPGKTIDEYKAYAIDYAERIKETRRNGQKMKNEDPFIMHLSFGAEYIRLVPGGRPADLKTLGYTAIAEYPLDGDYVI